MTTRVFKYPLGFNGGNITVPAGATVLDVQMQYGLPTLWVAVDTTQPDTCRRAFVTIGTGNEVPNGLEYIATVQAQGGDLVLHVFEDMTA